MTNRLNRLTTTAVAAIAFAIDSSPATAQQRGTVVEFRAGPALVVSTGSYSAAEQAVHAQLSIGRAWGARRTVSLVLDAFAGPESEATPGCIPGGACETRTLHPGALLGASLELRARPWSNGLAITGGVGFYTGPDVKGPVSRSSPAITMGADFGTGPVVLGFRTAVLTSNVANVRLVASPTLGLLLRF